MKQTGSWWRAKGFETDVPIGDLENSNAAAVELLAALLLAQEKLP